MPGLKGKPEVSTTGDLSGDIKLKLGDKPPKKTKKGKTHGEGGFPSRFTY